MKQNLKNTQKSLLRNAKRSQRGFNLIELMLGLAIVATLIVAIVRGSGSNSDKANSQIMTTDVTALVNGIKSAYSSGGNGYNGLDNQTARNLSVVPTDLPGTGATIKNTFGGIVTIASANSDQAFTITYTLVPPAVCQAVVNGMGGASFNKIEIGGQTVFENSSSANTPIDPGNVGTQCSAAGNSQTIIFTAS